MIICWICWIYWIILDSVIIIVNKQGLLLYGTYCLVGGDKQPNQHVMSQMVKNAMGKKKKVQEIGKQGGQEGMV